MLPFTISIFVSNVVCSALVLFKASDAFSSASTSVAVASTSVPSNVLCSSDEFTVSSSCVLSELFSSDFSEFESSVSGSCILDSCVLDSSVFGSSVLDSSEFVSTVVFDSVWLLLSCSSLETDSSSLGSSVFCSPAACSFAVCSLEALSADASSGAAVSSDSLELSDALASLESDESADCVCASTVFVSMSSAANAVAGVDCNIIATLNITGRARFNSFRLNILISSLIFLLAVLCQPFGLLGHIYINFSIYKTD